MTEQPATIADVEQMAAKIGITFAPEQYAEAYRLMDLRREQVERQAEKSGGGLVEKFNRLYPRFLKALHGIGDVSVTLVQTLLVGPGLLIVLFMLLFVEIERTQYGLLLFEAHPGLATLGAIVLVVLNLSLELWTAYVEHREGWAEPPRNEFSLRLAFQRLAYMVGGQTDWQPKLQSPAIRFRSGLGLVAATILILAAAGSMQDIIASVSGNWSNAIVSALTQSTLSQMVKWVSGLLFAVTMVKSAQLVSNYASRKAVEIRAHLAAGNTEAALEAANMTGITYLLAQMKLMNRERRAMAAAMPTHENIVHVSGVSSVSDTADTPSLPPSVARAVSWLETHPDTLKQSIREISRASGMSTSSVQRALGYLRQRGA